MLNVTLKLDSMHCHKESDNWFSSEPYLWTVFFHADIDTVFRPPGQRLAVYTPHSNWAARGMYRDDVDAGEDVDIPDSMGTYQVSLDDGDLGKVLVGVLYVLLEEDSTDSDAIRAGHAALADSANRVLNAYVDANYPNVSVPTPAQVAAMAAQIQADVKDAVADAQGWDDFFDDQDDVLGFGYQIYTYDDLQAITLPAGGEASFSSVIHHEKTVPSGIFGQTITLVNEYEVFGAIRVQSFALPLSMFELSQYQEAVQTFKGVEEEIAELRGEIRSTAGTEREKLIGQLQWLRRTIRPAAVRGVTTTRVIYNQALSAVRAAQAGAAAGEACDDIRANGARHSRPFRSVPDANVAEPRTTCGADSKRPAPKKRRTRSRARRAAEYEEAK